MGLKERLIEALGEMQNAIDLFESWIDPPNRTGSENYERWGPKDLLAHSLEWVKRQVMLLKEPEAVDPIENFDSMNRALFDQHGASRWDDLVQMMRDGIEALIYESIEADEAALVGEDPNAPGRKMWRGIAFYGILHSLSHMTTALIRSNKSDEAADLMRRMASRLSAIDYNNEWLGTVEFNLARVLAVTGDISATEHSNRAIVFNPKAAEWIENDADFDSIREELANSKS